MTADARPALAAWLAVVAGSVDAVGFAVAGRNTSHMSGTTTETMNRLAHGSGGLVLLGVEAILSFGVGAAICGFVVARRGHRPARSTIAWLLAAETTWVAAAGLVLALDAGTSGKAIAVAMLALAMGQQNATSTELIGDQTRTTHVTGVLTDLGRNLGALAIAAIGRSPAADRADRPIAGPSSLLAGFAIGAAIGTGAAMTLGARAVLVVALLPAAAVVACAFDASRAGAPR